MRNSAHKQYLIAAGLFLLASVAALWSWNTLSELFSLPQAQYRHALAALVLLLVIRWSLLRGRKSRRCLTGSNLESTGH
jgi:hypothetical protein